MHECYFQLKMDRGKCFTVGAAYKSLHMDTYKSLHMDIYKSLHILVG